MSDNNRTAAARRKVFWLNRRPYLLLPICVFLLVIVAACTTPPSAISLDEVLQREAISTNKGYGYRCTIGAHRGASEEFRENTVAALQAANSNSRYAFIEFDVQYSKDKRIVVYHDNRLLRLFGDLRAIGNTTFSELLEITDGEIAAYDEVIGTLDKKLNIEIKSAGENREDQQLVDEIMADLKVRGRDKDVMISSISAEVLRYIKHRYPSIPTGQIFWLTSSTYLHFDSLTKKLYEDIGSTRADYLMLHQANLRNIDNLLLLKPKGKSIIFWDFDDTMYIIHKDLYDRLWGDSSLWAFSQFLRFTLVSLFR